MITVCFSAKESADLDVINYFKLNENSTVSSYIDMPGLNPNIARPELHVDPLAKHVKQKARKIAPKLET